MKGPSKEYVESRKKGEFFHIQPPAGKLYIVLVEVRKGHDMSLTNRGLKRDVVHLG
jgi:hypothetical protein